MKRIKETLAKFLRRNSAPSADAVDALNREHQQAMTGDHNEMNKTISPAALREKHPITIKVKLAPHPFAEKSVRRTLKPILVVGGYADPNRYDDWIKFGKAWHTATNGGSFGLEAWMAWSAQAPGELNEKVHEQRWEMWSNIENKNVKIDAHLPNQDDILAALKNKPFTAASLLGQAQALQDQRAKDYDSEGGERSMGKVAAMFNVATQRSGDKAISESEAWLVMALLKIVRDRSVIGGHQDSCEDLVSYSALYAEARLKEGLDRFAVKKALNQAYVPAAPPAPPPVVTTLAERAANRTIAGALRMPMEKAVLDVKEKNGVTYARSLVSLYGKSEKLADVENENVQALFKAALVALGEDQGF